MQTFASILFIYPVFALLTQSGLFHNSVLAFHFLLMSLQLGELWRQLWRLFCRLYTLVWQCLDAPKAYCCLKVREMLQPVSNVISEAHRVPHTCTFSINDHYHVLCTSLKGEDHCSCILSIPELEISAVYHLTLYTVYSISRSLSCS